MARIATDPSPHFTRRTLVPAPDGAALQSIASAHIKEAVPTWAGTAGSTITGRAKTYPTAFGQVVLIQLAAAVDSLWPLPGFGQLAGAVMLRIGMVIMRAGSHTGKGYSARFLLKPVTASL